MSASMEPRKRPGPHPKRSGSKARHRLPPMALTGAVGAILVLALVLGTGCLTGGDPDERSGVTFSPPSTDLQLVGLLEVSATDVDLGPVALDQWVDHTFVLRNASMDTVTITIPKGGGVETLDGC